MESEKVKEIKKALQDHSIEKLKYQDGIKIKELDFIDILTLINELENENERLRVVFDIANERTYRKKFNDEWRKEYQKELNKQGNGNIAGYPDFDLVYKLYFEQKDRIAELEKKIENGTLVELHCKVGDIVYQFDNGGEIYELMILHINIYKGKPYYETDAIDFDNRAIGESIFLTKAEAEARLKELQEEQDND